MVADTPGAASVRPYPWSMRSPVRSVKASRSSSGSGAAPEITVVTVPKANAERSSAMICRQQRGRDRQIGDLFAPDHVQEIGEAGHHHHPGTGPQPAAENRVEAEDVEQRQRGQHHRVDVEKAEPVDLVQVGQQGTVAEHRRLGHTRRPRGGQQGRERLGILR